MSSSEEYLESLLQSMMNGEVATPSNAEANAERQKSAIAMLSGEEPEQDLPTIGERDTAAADDMKSMEAMLASMVDNLDENEDGTGIPSSDISITSDISGSDDIGMDISSLESENAAFDGITDDFSLEGSDAEDVIPVGGDMDELSLEDLGLNDLTLEASAIEEISADESASDAQSDELSLDELGLNDLALEEPDADMNDDLLNGLNMNDTDSSEELELSDLALEDTDMSDDLLGGLDLQDAGSDEFTLDDLALDDTGAGDDLLGGLGLDDTAADSLGMDDLSDLSIEESGMDDLALEESGIDDLVLDESGLDGLEQTASDGLDDLDLEGLDLDASALEGAGMDDANADDALLEELGLDDMLLAEPESDDMELDDTGLADMGDDFSLDESGMEDDLAEIHDLLDQSEQSGEIDDEMLALLESVSDSSAQEDTLADTVFEEETAAEEEPPAEGKKKKKKERKKRSRKKDKMKDNPSETEGGGASETGEETNTEKKPGAFARFLAFMTETDEEDEDEAGKASADENTELLEELSAEDNKNKKGKKEKKKKEKDKKGKKAANKEEGEEDEKAAKKKKPKKEKKVKVKDAETEKESGGKKLSKKKVAPVILFCMTLFFGIYICSTIVPGYLQKRDARVAYDMGNYGQTFDLLYGKDLNEEEALLLHKSTTILKLERKLESYRTCQKMGADELTTLNTLVQGVALYYELLPEAEQYHVTNEITNVYNEILAVLAEQYALYETDVMDIISSEDDVAYTQKLASIVYGTGALDNSAAAEDEGMQDVLPEEQEILDSLPDETADMPVGEETILQGETGSDTGTDMGDTAAADDHADAGIDGNAGTESGEDEIKYIEPVSVEIHQDN